MGKQGPCRDCSEAVGADPGKIEEILQYMVNKSGMKLVDGETIHKRLSLCMSCSAYTLEGTCRYCGCLVQIRTRIEGHRCPFPGEPKW